MKRSALLMLLMAVAMRSSAQAPPDTLALSQQAAGDDPSQFLSRVELFNTFERYEGLDLNRTVLRSEWKLRRRFSTRLDIPYVYNSLATADASGTTGIGDISFRLLGYQIRENPRSAISASMEVSLNTATSPLLGTGKNMLIPMVTHSRLTASKRTILAVAYQFAFSVGGDADRNDLMYSRIQAFAVHFWSRKTWTVLAPEWYVDHLKGGASMNMKARQAFAPAPRINIWVEAGAGVFGDFIARYEWTGQVGCRYFLVRAMPRTKSTGQ